MRTEVLLHTILVLLAFPCLPVNTYGQDREANAPPKLALQTGHSSQVESLDFSADGRFLASIGSDRRILVWEVRSGHVVQRIEGGFDFVSKIVFSPNGDRLAVGASNGIVGQPIYSDSSIWDIESGKKLSSLKGASGDIVFTPDGNVISKSNDGMLKLWDTKTGLPLRNLGAIDASILHIEVSLSGRWLVCNCRKEGIEVRRVSDGKVLRQFSTENMSDVFALSPDGSLLAWTPRIQRLEVLDTKSWTQKFLVKNLGTTVRFSKNGRWLVSSGADFQVWDLSSATVPQLTGTRVDDSTTVSHRTFAFGGSQLFAIGYSNGEVIVKSSPLGEPLRSFPKSSTEVGAQSINLNRGVFATGMSDGHIVIWSLDLGRPIAKYLVQAPVESLVFNAGGDLLVSSSASLWSLLSNNSPVLVLDVDTGRQVGSFETGGITSLALGDKRHQIATTGRKGVEVRLLPSGQRVDIFEGHTKIPLSSAFSPDGSSLVSGGGDGTAIVWDLASKSGKTLKTAPNNWVQAVAFTPDSKTLALGANEKVLIWNVEDSARLLSLEGHSAWISALAYSPGGQILASGSWDHTIQLWDARTGKSLHSLIGHAGIVRGVSFLSEKTLLSSSSDGTSKLWDVETGSLLVTLLSLGAKDWLAVTPEGLFDGTADAMQLIAWRRQSRVSEVMTLDVFYNDYFYPDLLAKIFHGQRPKPKIDISTLLHFPALRILSEQGYAHIEQRNGKSFLCLGQQASPNMNKEISILGRGTPIDLVRDFTFDSNDFSCTYRKELPSNGGPYELIGRSDNWKYQPAGNAEPSKTSTAKSRLHVLTIGIDKYQRNSTYSPLRFSVSDADAIKEFFRQQQNREGKPFADIVVWDGLRDEKATKESIREQLRLLSANAKEDDVVLLFFSGHGRVPPGQSMFYYIPFFQTQPNYSALDERAVGLNAAMFAEAIREMPAKRVVLIIDACQSGGALESLAKVAEVKATIEERNTRGEDLNIGKTRSDVGVWILAAATPVQEAAEPLPGTTTDKLKHSLLTEALLEVLQENAKPGVDGQITIRDLFNRVTRVLPRIARERQWVQTALPVHVGVDFPISAAR